MNNESLKNSIFSGVFWKFAERILAQGISFIVSVVLARILMPADYGIVALILVFINIANVFVTSGFNTALVQNKDADRIDFSTNFYCRQSPYQNRASENVLCKQAIFAVTILALLIDYVHYTIFRGD